MVCCCPSWCIAAVVLAIAAYVFNEYRKSKIDLKQAFSGKRVIVTGSSAGIGAETALQLSRLGAHVTLAARRTDLLEEKAKLCKAAGAASVTCVTADLMKDDDCKKLIRESVAAMGGIDVLVLNAGRGAVLLFEDTKDNDGLREVMEINYWSNLNLTRAALPELKKSSGNITVISSLAGKFCTPRRTGYSPTKFALNAFFTCLRMEIPSISVTIINPGFVVSDIRKHALGATPDNSLRNRNSMSTEECARLILVATANRERELVMTALGKVGVYIAALLPRVAEVLAIRISEREHRAMLSPAALEAETKKHG